MHPVGKRKWWMWIAFLAWRSFWLLLGDSRTELCKGSCQLFPHRNPLCVSQWIQTWCHLNPRSKPAKTMLKKWLASGRGKLWLFARGGDASGALSPALALSGWSISVPAELFSSDPARRRAASCLHSASYLPLWSSYTAEVNRGCFLHLCAWPAACWVSWHGQLGRCLFWWSILHKAVLEANVYSNFHLWREFKRCCSALPVSAKSHLPELLCII